MIHRWLIPILLLAAIVRVGYQDSMLHYGGSFHNGSDSGKYLVIAETISETGQFGRMSANGVEPELNRMPVYPYFLAGIFNLFGIGNLTAVVRIQILVDLMTIIGIYLSATAIRRDLAIPSALIAAILPNFLVHTSYVLTENIFLLFFVWGTCAILWALRGRQTPWMLIGAGIFFTLSLYTRPVMMFFPLFLFPSLACAFYFTRKKTTWGIMLLSVIPVVVMVVGAAPRVVLNYAEHGHVVFTSQSGGHLLKWVYPCLRTPWSCSSHGVAWDENSPIIDQRFDALSESEKNGAFAKDVLMRELGMQRIAELGLSQIMAGMAIGAIKNMIQTGVYETLTQFNQPPTFFSAMPGDSFLEKLSNFVKNNATNYFMFAWVIAQLSLMFARLIQINGIWQGLSDKHMRPYCIFLIAGIAYFLAINGPIGNPKYRIPADPALIILFVMGLNSVLQKINLWPKSRLGDR